MTDGTDKDIGRLEGKMDMLCDQMGTVHLKVDQILQGQCPQGKGNAEKIDALTKRTSKVESTLVKAIAIGLVTAGGGAGLTKLAVDFFK